MKNLVGVGFIVALIGMSAMDSPNVIPAVVITMIGLTLALIGAHHEED